MGSDPLLIFRRTSSSYEGMAKYVISIQRKQTSSVHLTAVFWRRPINKRAEGLFRGLWGQIRHGDKEFLFNTKLPENQRPQVPDDTTGTANHETWQRLKEDTVVVVTPTGHSGNRVTLQDMELTYLEHGDFVAWLTS